MSQQSLNTKKERKKIITTAKPALSKEDLWLGAFALLTMLATYYFF